MFFVSHMVPCKNQLPTIELVTNVSSCFYTHRLIATVTFISSIQLDRDGLCFDKLKSAQC